MVLWTPVPGCHENQYYHERREEQGLYLISDCCRVLNKVGIVQLESQELRTDQNCAEYEGNHYCGTECIWLQELYDRSPGVSPNEREKQATR